jgi:hypothetical protein
MRKAHAGRSTQGGKRVVDTSQKKSKKFVIFQDVKRFLTRLGQIVSNAVIDG